MLSSGKALSLAIKSDLKDFAANFEGPLSGEQVAISINDSLKLRSESRREWLVQKTASRGVIGAIFTEHPDAHENDLLYRYILYVLYGSWLDEEIHQPVIAEEVLEWIAGRPFYDGFTGQSVLQEIKAFLPGFYYRAHFHDKEDPDKNLARTILLDGVSGVVKTAADQDLQSGPDQRRVYLLSDEHHLRGAQYSHGHARDIRQRLRKELDEAIPLAPSHSSAYIWKRMNDRPSNLMARFTDHIEEARARTLEMDIKVVKRGGKRDRKAEKRLRRQYLSVLESIREQHQPFYSFSRRGRTDRIFSYNPSVLSLPSELRRILCQDFFEIDLRSAHLLIAAARWNARSAVERLVNDSVSIWRDFMAYFDLEHLEPGSFQYKVVKDALKIATYSAVYGMVESAIARNFTAEMKHVLGEGAGGRLRNHPVVRELLDCREARMEEIYLAGFGRAPSGIDARVDEQRGIDAKSVLATVNQSYEQLLMKVVLEFEEEELRNGKRDFRVVTWLHDGCYVHFAREHDQKRLLETGTNRFVNKLQRRLKERADELEVPAFFEAEPVLRERWGQ